MLTGRFITTNIPNIKINVQSIWISGVSACSIEYRYMTLLDLSSCDTILMFSSVIIKLNWKERQEPREAEQKRQQEREKERADVWPKLQSWGFTTHSLHPNQPEEEEKKNH